MYSEIIQTPATNTDKLTPKELIKKHIADPSHKITEEEFRRLIVGVAATKKPEVN